MPSYLGGDFVTGDDCLLLYNNIIYLNSKAYSTICDLEGKQAEKNATNDQIAAVMLLNGSDEQRVEALRYAGADQLADELQKTIDDRRMIFTLDRPISVAAFEITIREAKEKYGQHSIMRFRVAPKDNRIEIWFDHDDSNSTTQT